MDRPGHQLLSRPALAVDDDGAVRDGHLLDVVEDLPHAVAEADDLAEVVFLLQVILQRDVLFLEFRVGQGPVDGEFDDIVLEGLVI